VAAVPIASQYGIKKKQETEMTSSTPPFFNSPALFQETEQHMHSYWFNKPLQNDTSLLQKNEARGKTIRTTTKD
jgi:hypothetical protein